MPSAAGIQVFNNSDLNHPCESPQLSILKQRNLLAHIQLEHGTTVKCFKSKRTGADSDIKTLFMQIHKSDLFLEVPVGTILMEEASNPSNLHKLVVYQLPLAPDGELVFQPLCKPIAFVKETDC